MPIFFASNIGAHKETFAIDTTYSSQIKLSISVKCSLVNFCFNICFNVPVPNDLNNASFFVQRTKARSKGLSPSSIKESSSFSKRLIISSFKLLTVIAISMYFVQVLLTVF